jgi:hypothetical protein
LERKRVYLEWYCKTVRLQDWREREFTWNGTAKLGEKELGEK